MAINKKKARTPRPDSQHSPRRGKWFVEELLKHEFFTFMGKALGWLVTNYTTVLAILTAGTTAILQLVDVGANYAIASYIKGHPIRISIAAIMVALASPAIKALISLLFLWVKALISSNRNKEQVVQQVSESEKLIQTTGISGFYPHSTKAEKKKDWKLCVENIKRHRATDLRIMGATGWNTFGHSEAPLYKLLEQFNGEVKILLIDPDPTSPALIQRAHETNKTPEHYAKEVRDTLSRLKDLKQNKGRNVSVKLYRQTPIWKMVISNDFMWLQHYCKNKDVDNSPVYTFFSDGDEGTSLFHALYSVWLKRWEIDGNEDYDLTKP